MNEFKNRELESLQTKIESFTSPDKKLKKLGTLRGKLQQKVATITKEHKFFNENTVCPTCDQHIEESFRLNRINDAESKAKELQKGFEEIEEAIRLEEDKQTQFKVLSREATNLTHDISKTILGSQVSSPEHEIWSRKFKLLPSNLRIEILNAMH